MEVLDGGVFHKLKVWALVNWELLNRLHFLRPFEVRQDQVYQGPLALL